jgi:hypothetical protein
MCNSNLFLDKLHFFSRNVQAQLVFRDKLHFSQEMCNSIRFLETRCTFLKKCVTPADFSRHTFLKKCATPIGFLGQITLFFKKVQLACFVCILYIFV